MTDGLGGSDRRPLGPRQDLVHRSAALLPAGSEVRQAFICQSAPNFFFFVLTYLTGLTMFWNTYRCVAVTQDAIHVLDSSKLSGGARPQRLAATMPRTTRLGPVSGRWGEIDLLGERHWVHRRFHDQIAAADREIGGSA
ncbi:hypothetical protein LO771_13715 [Streptacidiphilus sp. ASG 303]|uniref:hypothetical protein n=1 Tax=Streptacidiphilus sp. ASG 303 TaxID=2896847 RepID=UPI001E3978D3|nr:hypothetical protein [Streptacidiphilus sp. ASG 303]MCD0483429.1 hypothetical protein [Streptacidiphilus sp. ASG 303]